MASPTFIMALQESIAPSADLSPARAGVEAAEAARPAPRWSAPAATAFLPTGHAEWRERIDNGPKESYDTPHSKVLGQLRQRD